MGGADRLHAVAQAQLDEHIGFLAGAVRPARWVRALLVLHLAFGVVKVAGYHESAAVPFMCVDVLLLWMLSRRPS